MSVLRIHKRGNNPIILEIDMNMTDQIVIFSNKYLRDVADIYFEKRVFSQPSICIYGNETVLFDKHNLRTLHLCRAILNR